MPVGQGTGSSVSTQDLPVLAPSNSGNAQMSAQPQLAPVTPAPQPVPVVATASTTPSSPVVVPTDAYVHTIASGESLYTIARLYNVTAQAIVIPKGLVYERPKVAEVNYVDKAVNERLWVIEDDIRLKEKAQAFDEEFIRLARAVYFENDERARIKKDINLALGSSYVEEKSYQDYRAG